MRTLLKVLSILLIIGAAISIVLGVVTIGGGGVIAGLGGYGYMGLTADESFGAALVGGVAVVMGIFLILSAAFNLITGIFGIIGANGGTGKLKAALVMGWISLVLSVIGAIVSLSGDNGFINALLQVILPLLFVIAATNVKKEQA